MSLDLNLVATYTKMLGSRPKGYIRDPQDDMAWEVKAWRTMMHAQKGTWDEIYPLMLQAESICGLRDLVRLDRDNTQDLSEHFYALYEDMLLEFLRSHDHGL